MLNQSNRFMLARAAVLFGVLLVLAAHPASAQEKKKKLYVGNLSYQTTEDDLTDLFEQIGEVICVNIVTDKDTGRSKGFGFIVMNAEDADRAIAHLNGAELAGRRITVNEARGRSADCDTKPAEQ
ncbi:MAG TPA: RNA-binding protein [Ktedonobacteraceae bacterium]|nr:RNA-binding protein [Ktedonobacteraceae bacterium]